MCVIVEFAFGYSKSTDYEIYRSTVTAESVLFCMGVTYCDCNHYVIVPGNPSPPLPLNKRQCMIIIVCSFYDSLWYIFVILIVIAKQYILHLVRAHLRKLMIIIKT